MNPGQAEKVIIEPHEILPVQVRVTAENVSDCFVNIRFDTNYLELIEGYELNSLGAGSFLKRLSWVLQAVKVSDRILWTEITAEAENLFQVVGFNLVVVKNKNSKR